MLQNLVVVQGGAALRGLRRRAAARRAHPAGAAGRPRRQLPVPVLVVPADQALIASLSGERLPRAGIPADEFAAFAKLLAQNQVGGGRSRRLRRDAAHRQRRMKLATVSPKLIALFANQIGGLA